MSYSSSNSFSSSNSPSNDMLTTQYICGHSTQSQASHAHPDPDTTSNVIFIHNICPRCERHNDYLLSPAQYAESFSFVQRLSEVATPEPGDSPETLALRRCWQIYNESEKEALESAKEVNRGNVSHACGHLAIGVAWGDGEAIAKRKCDGCLEREKKHERLTSRGRGRRW